MSTIDDVVRLIEECRGIAATPTILSAASLEDQRIAYTNVADTLKAQQQEIARLQDQRATARNIFAHLKTHGDLEFVKSDIDEWLDNRAIPTGDRDRLLEEARTAFKKLRPFIYCDMGEECAEHGHWEDCATNVAGKILDDIEAKLGASNQ